MRHDEGGALLVLAALLLVVLLDPSDVTEDCAIVFDFRGFGTGLFTVERMTLVDVGRWQP